MSTFSMAQTILSRTNDGDDLSPKDYRLVNSVFDHNSTKALEIIISDIYSKVINNLYCDWFHGIRYLTIDHNGSVYWKGEHIEDYYLPLAYTDEAQRDALGLAISCEQLEKRGQEVNFKNYIEFWR